LTEDEVRTQTLVTAMRRVIGRVHSRLKLRILASVAGHASQGPRHQDRAPVLVRENTWFVDPEGRSSTGSRFIAGTGTRWTWNLPHGRRVLRVSGLNEGATVRRKTGVLYGLSILAGCSSGS